MKNPCKENLSERTSAFLTSLVQDPEIAQTFLANPAAVLERFNLLPPGSECEARAFLEVPEVALLASVGAARTYLLANCRAKLIAACHSGECSVENANDPCDPGNLCGEFVAAATDSGNMAKAAAVVCDTHGCGRALPF